MKQQGALLFGFAMFCVTQLTGCPAVIFAGGTAGAASIASDQRTTGTVIEDQAIEFRIANSIAANPELGKNSHINVTSYNNFVLLTGETPTEDLRNLAYEIALQDPKVKKVYNELQVAEPLPLNARNYDSWLTTKVKTKLLTVKEINLFQVKVVKSNQTVYLLGIVPDTTGNLAAEVAAQVDGVQKVVKAFEYSEAN